MKRRSREISIFSMSALDLFASALGAFILIAIVIFPYFPNTARAPVVVVAAPDSPACPPVLPCPDEPCPDCPVCPVCPDEPDTPAARFPHLDLVIALDVTGSMGDQIAGLKAEVGQLSRLLVGLTPSLGMGVVAYGDREYDSPVTTFALREISGSPGAEAALRRFVDGLSTQQGRGAGSNPDAHEALLRALREARRMSWRPDAEQRVIVLITDNPAYPDEVEEAVSEAASFAAAGDGRVSAVLVNNGRSVSWTESFLARVASAGRGELVLDTSGSMTVNLLLSLI